MKDTYRHKGLRRQLVDQLYEKGIKDAQVLAAMEAVPRHFFMDKAFIDLAYVDKAFPIGNNQSISQPYTVAFQTSLLQIKKRDKVLEIGTGSGYQAAVLASLGARVYTIERQEGLYHKTSRLLQSLGFGGIRCYLKDGHKGLAEFAPFDKMIVTAAASELPEKLLKQLKIGGQLIIPMGDEKGQTMLRITRLENEKYKKEEFGKFKFVPFLKGINKE